MSVKNIKHRVLTVFGNQLILVKKQPGKIENFIQKQSPTPYGTIQQSITSCQ